MRIVIIEYCIYSHFETLGFFFYLHQKYGIDIDIYVWKRNLNNSWLNYFNNNVCDSSSITILPIETLFKQKNEADILYINTFDQIKNRVSDIKKIKSFHNFKRFIFQRHVDEKNYPKLGFEYELISLFPINNHTRLLLPYDVGVKINETIGEKIRLTIVGNIKCTKRENLSKITDKFQVTHFYRNIGNRAHANNQIPNVKYLINKSTKEMIDYIVSCTDYIYVDYTYNDRMTGILLHAIALEVPLLISKNYFDKLSIPENICVTYESYEDILSNKNISDQSYYDILVDNIRKYKQELINESVEYFINE